MTVTFRWDNDARTVQIYQFERVWTWDDFYRTKALADEAITQTGHAVDVVFDGPPDVKLPDGFVHNVVNISRTRHPRARLAVVVMPNTFVRAMFNTVSRLYGREFAAVVFVPSLEAARTAIAERDKQEAE